MFSFIRLENWTMELGARQYYILVKLQTTISNPRRRPTIKYSCLVIHRVSIDLHLCTEKSITVENDAGISLSGLYSIRWQHNFRVDKFCRNNRFQGINLTQMQFVLGGAVGKGRMLRNEGLPLPDVSEVSNIQYFVGTCLKKISKKEQLIHEWNLEIRKGNSTNYILPFYCICSAYHTIKFL